MCFQETLHWNAATCIISACVAYHYYCTLCLYTVCTSTCMHTLCNKQECCVAKQHFSGTKSHGESLTSLYCRHIHEHAHSDRIPLYITITCQHIHTCYYKLCSRTCVMIW